MSTNIDFDDSQAILIANRIANKVLDNDLSYIFDDEEEKREVHGIIVHSIVEVLIQIRDNPEDTRL